MQNSSLNAKGIICTEMFCLYCNLVNSQKSKSMNLTEPERLLLHDHNCSRTKFLLYF